MATQSGSRRSYCDQTVAAFWSLDVAPTPGVYLRQGLLRSCYVLTHHLLLGPASIIIESDLELVGPVSAYRDWMR